MIITLLANELMLTGYVMGDVLSGFSNSPLR